MAEQNEPLSERELEILRLVATGAANKEIAIRLVISPNTVKVHLRNIFSKIGVSSRTEATLYAINIGLVHARAAPSEPESLIVDDGSASRLGVAEANPPETTAAAATPARWLKTWQWTVLAALLLLVLTASIAALRLMAPLPTTPTVQSDAAAVPSSPQRWAEKASLPTARKGMGYAVYENRFYLVAGETASGLDGALYRYDPAGDVWESLAEKPTPVTEVQAALLGEKIYVPGGRLADGRASGLLEVYDPRSDSWESLADLPLGAWGYALAAYEGQLYLFGGKNEHTYLSGVYTYLPQEDRWEEKTALSGPRAYASAVVLGNKIHLLGGLDGSMALDLNEAYFPTRDDGSEQAWEAYSPLPTPRYGMGGTYLAGLAFLVGGMEGDQPSKLGLQYLAQVDRWYEFDAPPRQPGAQPAMLASGNFIHLLGGETASGIVGDHQAYQAIYIISVPLLQQEE